MDRDQWREHGSDEGSFDSGGAAHDASPGKQTLTSRLGGAGRSADSVASAMLNRLGLGPVQRKQAEREATAPADDGPAPDDRLFLVAHEPDPGEITPIQMQAMVDHTAATWAGAAQAQPASDGAGQRMPEAVQAKMERSFGVDFSSVRVHEGPQASSIGAAAYTQGTNIHFAEGEYSPHSHSGQELLGHELAHVVQQSQGRVQAPVQGKGGVGVNADPGLEAEADAQGARAASGEAAGGGAAGAERELTREELDQLYPPDKFIPVSLSAFTTNVVQPAYTAKRPLGRSALPMIPLPRGLGTFHEHIFFEDGGDPPNIGFMGAQGLGQDTSDGYTRLLTGLDDALMRQAVAAVGNPGEYSLIRNNCQDYVASVVAQYNRLRAARGGGSGGGGGGAQRTGGGGG
jgi:hypothetical protein